MRGTGFALSVNPNRALVDSVHEPITFRPFSFGLCFNPSARSHKNSGGYPTWDMIMEVLDR